MKYPFGLTTVCLLTSLLTPASGQPVDSVMFHAETLSIPSLETTTCVQLGLYMTYRGSRKRAWSVLNSSLNYIAPPGMLAADPVVRISDFTDGDAGLTNPGTNHVDHREQQAPCDPLEIVNSITLNRGLDTPFAGGSGNCDCSDSVNSRTGRIELVAAGRSELFSTSPGSDALYAVITFPIAPDVSGRIDLQFVPDTIIREGNVLLSETGEALTAFTVDGSVTVQDNWPALTLWEWGLVAFLGGFILPVLLRVRTRRVDSD